MTGIFYFSDLSTENLKYLTSEQALHDAAAFIEYLTKKKSLAKSKWLVFGGSYSGSLAAWLRLKYPHLVAGAVASSAPIEAIVNFKNYLQVVTDSLGPKCAHAVREATDQLAAKLKKPSEWQSLRQQFHLYYPLNGTNRGDVATLALTLAANFMTVVQYNNNQVFYLLLCQPLIQHSQYP